MTKKISQISAKFFITLVLIFLSGSAIAGDFPSKPITVIVPFPAGGSTDIMARSISVELTDYFGKNVVVSNTGGGAGTVGLASIARIRKDGYTIGIVPAAPLVNQPHMRKTPYDHNSFDYICQVFSSAYGLAVKPNSPFSTLNGLVDYAKVHPNELTYGSPGPGSLPHLAMEQFLEKFDLKIKHVPFTGDGPGVTALLGNHVDMYLMPTSVVVEKEVKAVAVFSEDRVDSLPDLPTAKEQGYDITASWWGGIIGPKGIPEKVKERLSAACVEASKSKRLKNALNKLGSEMQYLDPVNFKAQVESVSETNGRLIKKLLLTK
ncbi:Bug family tripartite tricarboxylate transporter substrate binding protein [Desulforhopalus singaporensis]|uniref:Tripartite-type tricarboxylate transporter, receptor component TctC n=1 Tax=Desulforhopalus singaporensis TaxID=91360 RepID=A0A1H0V1X0_9BACT|nr:tripartite tricarboxylate transporter substrate binding protein [Desulforhopalus singaporensis]SDP72331.1 Tripartite-type tricarboxylate transporter, receptor component TctC [Desulforhopalus singaporensis]